MTSSGPTTSLILEYTSDDPQTLPLALRVVQGNCPANVLTDWSREFSAYFDRHPPENQEDRTVTFKTGPHSLPRTFRVEFLGKGRSKSARLTIQPFDNRSGLIAKPSRELSLAPAVTGPPPDWRLQMLDELDRFVAEFARDEAERTSLEFAVQQMRLLARESPERLTLMLFGAFVAGAHSPPFREMNAAADLVFQAAAAALRRTVDESELTGKSASSILIGANPAWSAIRTMCIAWLPIIRRPNDPAPQNGELQPHA